MSNIKKIIGVVLAIVMALSVATIAFAAEGDDAYSVIITSDKATISETESATVTVSVTSNYYSNAMSIPVFFDSTKVTISDATALIDFGEVVLPEDVDDTYYTKSGYTKADHGAIVFLYVPRTHSPISKYETATAVMTFKVTAKAGTSGSVALECLEATAKTTTDASGALFVAKDKVTGSTGSTSEGLPLAVDNFTLTNATLTIAGGAEPADLALTDKGTTDGVIIDTTKTFGGQYDGAVYGFPQATQTTFINTTYLKNSLQATNNGTLSYSRTIGTSGYGTGTLITVKNADSTESKHYIVIIFGDVDGNGMINTTDVTLTKSATTQASVAPENSVKRMAANTAGANALMLRQINTADVTATKYFTTKRKFSSTSTVTTMANAHKKVSNYQ